MCSPGYLGLVVEDAIAGMKSGRAAGAHVLAVCTSTTRAAILESDAKPDFIVSDLTM
jgi:beta-phosphoglucomutase-like phosphatase (HAD superfamily)